jgi:UDP-glucose 4-epimerase
MKKILVTGGAGFIGTHTCVKLHESGYLPVIVDNLSNSHKSALDGLYEICGVRFPFYDIDCTDEHGLRSVFEAEGPLEGVIHFAAFKAVGESVRKPLEYYSNNVGSLITLLKVMKEFKVANLVFSSSCTVYGQPDELPVTEDTPWQVANSPYGFTKQVCEQMLTDIGNSGESNFAAILLRYFNPIGAHHSGLIGELPLGKPENLVPYITQTAVGQMEELVVFGSDYATADGTCVRDYIHVMDLANAHVLALKWLIDHPGKTDCLNLGTGKGYTVLQVIKAFEAVSGSKLNYKIGPRRAGDVVSVYASADKALKELHWRTEMSLEDALRDAWNWQLKLSKKPKHE